MNRIDVLNHGFVRLVDSMGNDLSVVRAARVSYDAPWRAGEDQGSDTRLIRYLWTNHHTTPFEAVTFTFAVKAPMFVFRQWHRHRTWSFNELSARYRELPEEYYLPHPEHIGQQATTSKQARVLTDLSAEEIQQRRLELSQAQAAVEECFSRYRLLLRSGWPKELARSILLPVLPTAICSLLSIS